jgi:hypothetical protein
MAGNGISGTIGDVLYNTGGAKVSEVKSWSFNPKQESKSYSSNKTGGGTKRISSTKDASGTIEGVWDAWDPITDHFEPGSEVTLKLQHYTNQWWIVPVLIDDMSFDVDIETGDVQSWSANFSLNGTWTKPVALATTTTTTTAAPLMAEFEQAGELKVRHEAANPSGVNNPDAADVPEEWPVFEGTPEPAKAPTHGPMPPRSEPQRTVPTSYGPPPSRTQPTAIQSFDVQTLVAEVMKQVRAEMAAGKTGGGDSLSGGTPKKIAAGKKS